MVTVERGTGEGTNVGFGGQPRSSIRPDDLRLQSDYERDLNDRWLLVYRYARPSGWTCGCWHPTPEEAAVCIRARY